LFTNGLFGSLNSWQAQANWMEQYVNHARGVAWNSWLAQFWLARKKIHMMANIADKIFHLKKEAFTDLALEVFRFQYANNELYRAYAQAFCANPERVKGVSEIPFLPIGFFKNYKVQTTVFEAETVFESSGTSGLSNSRHFVKEVDLYKKSFLTAFEWWYGPVDQYCILGLLPSYLERRGSSLVYMVDALIKRSGHAASGFYLDDHDKLARTLGELEKTKKKTLLIGVTYALLDFAESCPMDLSNVLVMETGGMKGRRKEMTREEVHLILKQNWGLEKVNSEYGMTELLSQAYSLGEGIFETVPWMKVLIRNEDDPLDVQEQGNGALNIVDLANIYSCSFIATEDTGRVLSDGKFEVYGRLDNSDLRGCSLLII
jgi:hypothetical protein